jgi:hypothetical protein
MKEREGNSDGDDESESSESAGESGKSFKKAEEGKIVHVVSPEPDNSPELNPVAGTSKDTAESVPMGGGEGGIEPVAGKSTDGLTETGEKKRDSEKGEPDRKGVPEESENSEIGN